MPGYFFNYKNGKTVFDDVGMELPGVEEARHHARIVASELTRNVSVLAEAEIIIADEWDKPIARVRCCG